MKNITLAVDEDVLKAARKYAAARNTTVNAIVREHLTHLVTLEDRSAKARQRLVELAKASTWDPGPGYAWDREEVYDRDRVRGHQHPRPGRVASSGRSKKKAKGA